MKFSKKYTQLLVAAVFSGISASAGAAAILFAHVDQTGPYIGNGNQLASMLTGGGHTVTTRFLNQATYNDYASFDQIFVYDLYTGLSNNANQQANYTCIANWYNGLTNQNLILDGRIISSTTPWENPPETAWIQNYATQLDSRGGGLVLGTDHANFNQDFGVFVDGINTINDLINVDRFRSNFNQFPFEALVDPLSPLYVPSLLACSSSPADQCINDNSSTSFAAAGLQPNGQLLTPVAYHGTSSQAFSQAAVSSTIGSATFGTCDDGSVPLPDGTCPNGGPGPGPSPIPEPSIITLFGLGLLGLGFARRRKCS